MTDTAKGNKYRVLITSKNFKKVVYDATLFYDELQSEILKEVPECNVDFKRIEQDHRCKDFIHYMPINATVAKHAYKVREQIMKTGSKAQIFISNTPTHERKN